MKYCKSSNGRDIICSYRRVKSCETHISIGRDVGSISNLGGTTLRGHFLRKKKGHFLRIKRALVCLLQNLGGTCMAAFKFVGALGLKLIGVP